MNGTADIGMGSIMHLKLLTKQRLPMNIPRYKSSTYRENKKSEIMLGIQHKSKNCSQITISGLRTFSSCAIVNNEVLSSQMLNCQEQITPLFLSVFQIALWFLD